MEPEPVQENVRMSGFLEKKGKMKLMSPWKKYWFVLEKRLLLYYRSKIEYTNLSPCRGSLNMGLVTTVRPGTSSGPCVIHIITRTQSVQLRAKNRAAQEEWLQALLHSMALPTVPKILKPPTSKAGFLGCTSSLDNVSINGNWKRANVTDDWTLPRKLPCHNHKREISGAYYGGSLDTAIWSKKFRPVQSPIVPKGKLLEKFLGMSRDSDATSSVASSQRDVFAGPTRTHPPTAEGQPTNRRMGEERKCKVHQQNRQDRGHPSETRQSLTKTFSDNQLTKSSNHGQPAGHNSNSKKVHRRDETAFERLRHAFGRGPREKSTKAPSEADKGGVTRKRRQSFLQKVFKLKDEDVDKSERDFGDSLYDSIDQVRRTEPVSEKAETRDECLDPGPTVRRNPADLYAEVKKNLAKGSRTILPDTALAELKTKLKSRESLDRENPDADAVAAGSDDELATVFNGDSPVSVAPRLPPRRVSRPVSPWHDVPSNNAPIDSDRKLFYSHQAVVRFKDSSGARSDGSDVVHTHADDSVHSHEENNNSKSDDLSVLLEQLTKITVAPLAEPEFSDENGSRSSGSDKFFSRHPDYPDPDYDVPRPHKPVHQPDESDLVVSPIPLIRRLRDVSSFQSIEPDSLETEERKFGA